MWTDVTASLHPQVSSYDVCACIERDAASSGTQHPRQESPRSLMKIFLTAFRRSSSTGLLANFRFLFLVSVANRPRIGGNSYARMVRQCLRGGNLVLPEMALYTG